MRKWIYLVVLALALPVVAEAGQSDWEKTRQKRIEEREKAYLEYEKEQQKAKIERLKAREEIEKERRKAELERLKTRDGDDDSFFDWLDSNGDGVVSRAELSGGLGAARRR